MLDFPSSPQIDDTLTGPSGQVWRWDGVKWTAIGGAGGGNGGGDGGGPWFPLMGVTDGSAAAPGEVGEIMSAWNRITATQYNFTAPDAVVSLNLTPGDWQVWTFVRIRYVFSAAFSLGIPASVSFIWRLDPALSNPTAPWYSGQPIYDSFHLVAGETNLNKAFSLPTLSISTSTGRTVTAFHSYATSTPNGTLAATTWAEAYMTARRMR